MKLNRISSALFLVVLGVSVTAILAAQTAFTASLPAGVQRITSVEGITEYSFPNGLHVLLFPDPSKQTTTVNITYLVGSRHENYGESGMAHLLEHMSFKGTPNHPNIPKVLNERGASFNATTSYDRTNYFETLPATDDNLKWMLDFEADRMVNSYVAKKDLDSEMTVVRNEFESGENSPSNVLYERMMSTAYLAHAYHRSVIGFRSDIENVPIQHLQAFYHTYYQPDNAVLTVAGNFTEAKALDYVVQTFGQLPKPQRTLTKFYTLDPVQDGERSVSLRRVGDTQVAGVMYHLPDGANPDFAALNILANILGNAPSGRLYKALVETKKATDVSADTFQAHDPGILMAFVEVRNEGNINDARDTMVQTVEEFVKTPPTKEEFERARTALLKEKELTLSDSSRLGFALSEWIAKGDWRLFFLDRDRIRQVTPEDVQRVAAKYLISSNRTLGTFIPTTTPVRAEIPPASDVASMLKDYKGEAAVAQGEAFDPTPANIEARTQRASQPSGLKLALLSKKTRGNLVVGTLVLRFGDEKSLQRSSKVSELVAAMLDRGTAKHTRQQISDELDRLKARVAFRPGVGQVSAGFETVRDNLPAVVTLVVEMLREPSFPTNELESLKQEMLADIESGLREPQAVASNEFDRRMNPYPSGHPRYVATMEEEIAETKAATLDQLKTFHADFYGAQSGQVSVVGDFDEKEVTKLAADLLGNWKSKKALARIPEQYFDVSGQRKTFDIPDKANAIYLLGLNLPMRDDDPDYPALLLANEMLGGGILRSRLADRIRQKDGLSYGVGSELSISSLDKSGSFTAYAIFAPQNLSRLEAAFKEEIERARQDGFTDDELAAAKSGWLQGRKVRRGRDSGVASTLANYLFIDRTFAWDADLEKRVEAVTHEQAQAALQKYIDPSKLTIVTAGSFATAAK
ncbi:MAG TPA: pitrilysin family protein [Terriglobales bacterium]|nr:pitrilysin family protein [Terriglobales bacterium]